MWHVVCIIYITGSVPVQYYLYQWIKSDTYRSTECISHWLDRGITALIMWVFFLMSNIKFETLMQRWGNATLRCKMLISNNLDHAACVALPRRCRHWFGGQVNFSHCRLLLKFPKPLKQRRYFLIRSIKMPSFVITCTKKVKWMIHWNFFGLWWHLRGLRLMGSFSRMV